MDIAPCFHDEALGERAVIVGAVGTDGEQLIAPLHENRILGADTPEDLAAIGKTLERESLAEIGRRSALRFCHTFPRSGRQPVVGRRPATQYVAQQAADNDFTIDKALLGCRRGRREFRKNYA